MQPFKLRDYTFNIPMTMRTRQEMQKQKLRYFSGLSAKQKDQMINDIRAMRKGIFDLPEGLRNSVLGAQPWEDMISEKSIIENMLKGAKCFKHPKGYYPLNLKFILKTNINK